EKLSHLRFYWHDVVSGPDPTAVTVARAAASSTNASASGFGTVVMIDDPMTVGPELSSRLVGRAQGFYALAAKEETALLMAMNLAFVEGKYNGSTIAVLGRNAVFSDVREMPVVGGSGLLVGRAQGFYAFASKEESALLMAMNFAFVEGKYNGSTIAVLGRNAVFSGVREMPVVGGSGLFRLARGYAQARTYSFDTNTGDTVVEYNLFVTHY
ncbi:unnamed protein product, partial [Musa hybrid cultivar]